MKKLVVICTITLMSGLSSLTIAQSNNFNVTPNGILLGERNSVSNQNQINDISSPDVWEPIGPNGITSNAIAVDPLNTDIIYAGGLAGLYKTTNGGMNWFAVGDSGRFHNIKCIAINPINTNVLLVWSYYGVEREFTMHRSTDSGSTWTEVLSGSGSRGNIVFDFQNTQRVFAHANNDYAYRSADGGINWIPISSFWVISLAMDAINPDILYALGGGLRKTTDGGQTWDLINSQLPAPFFILKISINDPYILFAGDRDYDGGFYKSNDGGLTWTQSNSGFGSIKSITTIGLDPENENILYAGGFASKLYVSTDKGDQWSLISDSIYDNWISAMTTMPNNKLYCSFGGSIFLTSDQGTSWNSLNGDLKNVDVFDVVVHPTNPDILYANSFAGIYRSYDGGSNWQQINNGISDTDAFGLAIDQSNPNKLYAGSYGGLIYKSTNGGDLWEESSNGLPGLGQSSIGKVTVHPYNSSWVWTGDYIAFQSTDEGNNWSELYVMGERVHDMIYSPGNSAIMYAISDSKLFITTNQGANWSIRNNSYTSGSLVVDPNDSNILFAYNFDTISKSTDGGLTWNVLDSLSVREISINSQHSNFVYAATRGNGVRRSTDGGASWHNYNNGLTNLRCFSVRSATGQPHKLYLSTFGSSIYQVNETVTSVNESDFIVLDFSLSPNYPNPFNPSTTIKFSLPSSAYTTLKIYNALGAEIAVLLNKELTTGTYEIEWNATGLPSGIYFYQLKTEGYVETKKMILMK